MDAKFDFTPTDLRDLRGPLAALSPPRVAALAAPATLAVALLGLELQEDRIAVFWPAAGVITGLFLVTRGPRRVAAALGVVAALALAALIAGRGLGPGLVFLSAQLLQASLILGLLGRFGASSSPLATLPRAGGFFVATALGAGVVGLLAAGALRLLEHSSGEYWKVWATFFASQGVGLITVTPAVLAWLQPHSEALRDRTRDRLALPMLTGLGAMTVIVVAGAPINEKFSLIVLSGAIYPMLLGLAARSHPVWPTTGLLIIAITVVWQTGRGTGLFAQRPYDAQLFLTVVSMWTLTLIGLFGERRRAWAALATTEAKVLEALSIGRVFTFDYDPLSNVVVRSDHQHVLAPQHVEDASQFMARLPEEDRARLLATIGALSPAHPGYEIHYRYRREDGRLIWLDERAKGEFDASGRLIRLTGLTADVTERKQAERAQEEDARAKDRFIATLSHELRNPLSPIRLSAGIIKKGSADARLVEQHAGVIERQSAHMARLLDDLLDLGRITAGKIELRKERVLLSSILEQAIETARPLLEREGRTFEVRQPEPSLRLEVDPVRLSQVVSNLLTNAARYTEPGGHITLEARMTRAPSAGEPGELSLRVQDDGVGIEAENQPHLFEMFAQFDAERGRASEGLGIGLSLVHELVKLHGGAVVARSEGLGRGSEFIVRLPVDLEALQSTSEQDQVSRPPHGNGLPRRARILVVDDNRDSADMMADVLRMDGHEVLAVYGGEAALSAATTFEPALVLLDLGMPERDGFDVCRILRARHGHRMVIIAQTGWGRADDLERTQQAGFDHHLVKPIDPDALLALVREHTDRAPQPPPNRFPEASLSP